MASDRAQAAVVDGKQLPAIEGGFPGKGFPQGQGSQKYTAPTFERYNYPLFGGKIRGMEEPLDSTAALTLCTEHSSY